MATYKLHEKVLVSKDNVTEKIAVRILNRGSEDVKEFEDFDTAFKFASEWLLQNFTTMADVALVKKGGAYLVKSGSACLYISDDKYAAWAKVLLKRYNK